MTPVVSAMALSKIFRSGRPDAIRAIVDIDLEIGENQFSVFLGASGSGKTTLMNLLGGILRPTRGFVFFRGRDLARLPDFEISGIRRRHMGFVLQKTLLLPRLSSWENVALPLVPMGVGHRDRYGRACRLLESLGLGDRLGHLPRELSGGEQQRVAIARALINDPAVLFADEPTSDIDEESRGKVLAVFRELQRNGKTILLNTHDEGPFEDADVHYTLTRGRLDRRMRKAGR